MEGGIEEARGSRGASFPVCWDSLPRTIPTYLGGNDALDHYTEPVHEVQAVRV